MITNLNNYLNTNYPSIEQQIKRIISNLSTSWEDFLANTEPNGMEIRHSGWPNTKMYVGEDGVIRATAGARNPDYYGKINTGFNEFLNFLLPNTHYVVDDYMDFYTDEQARTIRCKCSFTGSNTTYRGRNCLKRQFIIENGGKQDDEIGHLIPNLVGGPNEAINVVPMNYDTNHKSYLNAIERMMDVAWHHNHTVEFSIDISYTDNRRPSYFLVNSSIKDKTDYITSCSVSISNS